MTSLGLFLFSNFIYGCASTQETREGARLVAAYTEKIRSEAKGIVDDSEGFTKLRQKNLNRLELNAVETENANILQREVWNIVSEKDKKDQRLKLLDQIAHTAKMVDEQKKSLDDLHISQEKLVKDTKINFKLNLDKLSESAKAMGQLAEKPDFGDNLKFFAGFFKTVKTNIDKSNQEAKSQATKGEKAVSDTVSNAK
jgi:hypothetical protein